MSTATSTWQPQINASVLAGLLGNPLPDAARDITAEFVFPGFNYSCSAPLIGLSSSTDFQGVTAQIELDENVLALCEFKGRLDPDNREFRVQEVKLRIEVTTDRPRAHFIASTIQALLWMESPMRLHIAELQFDEQLNFTAPLEKIGRYIHRRYYAYRLMVIEQVFKETFSMPPHLYEADARNISYVYQAITEHSVLRPFRQNSFPFRADEQTSAMVEASQPFPYRLMAEQRYHDLLGKTLHVGQVIMTIERAVIVNIEDVRHELKRLDGHEFKVVIRSLDGAARHEFPDVPSLGESPWDEPIAELIKLEGLLDDRFFQAANQLAASTLDDLTEEEIAAISERPQLDEEAFNFDDPERET
jgi:hypothetical protein